jgi:hypothetical protein
MMFFKREVAILRVLAAALSVFLLADGGILTAAPSPLVKMAKIMEPAEMLKAVVPAPDSECPVLEAMDKLFATPFHMYMTQTSAGVANGKPMNTEMVSSGGARYVLYQGKWTVSPLSTEELKALDQRNRQNAKNTSCHYVRDESVNGESAALYSTHSESEHGISDNQIWVSKSKGLVLRQETDLYTGRGNGKSHLSVRYEYANVQAPKL